MMDTEVILKIVLLGIIHWTLVPIALRGLVEGQRVLGGQKGIWVVAIVFITCFGPLSYLILHELVPQPKKPQTQLDLDN